MVASAYDAYIDGMYYNIKGDEATVTYRGNYYGSYSDYYGSVVIPSSVTYQGKTYTVTSIGGNAFSGSTHLTSITIPNSVTSIGSYAFRNCTSLTSIIIHNSVTNIGDNAFQYCSSLTSIIVEAGNGKYDSRDNCNAIIETTSNTLIAGCMNTVIPNSVTSIGNEAFCGCSSLTFITIPNSVTSIGRAAFYECTSLTSVIIPNSVTSIPDHSFNKCSSLTSITIPNSVTTIGEYAFYGCSDLTSVTIGNSVTSIVSNAFHGCSSLTSVTLNSNAIVSALGSSSSLMKSIFGNQVKEYVIGDSVTSIGDYAFQSCSGLTSITIPNSVTTIGKSAFRDCSSLTSITIPNSVTSIGRNAFYGCSSLTSVTIPNSVTSISERSFSFCSSLTSITIPNSVTSIGKSAFYECTSLTSVAIPNSVTSIGDYAFSGCSGLTSVTIPNSVTSIGDYAFQSCSGLTSLISGNSVTNIGEYAFYGCSGLTSFIIPNSVTSIGRNAFFGCSGLTSFIIPNNVTSIGEGAFASCSNLTSIKVEAENSKYDSRNNCNAILETTSNTLIAGCQSTIIPNSVTSIGNGAFSGCYGLTSITIPNSVTSIGGSAFWGCTSLTSITIGNITNSIGNYAFSLCNSLTDVYCYSDNVPNTGSFAFDESSISSATLHVPTGSIDAYSTTEPWSGFASIIAIPSYTLTYMVDGGTYKTVLYEEGESITPEEAPTKEGYTFSGWEGLPETMPAKDVTVTASFTINQYLLTYMIDGKEYKSYELDYNTALTPEPAPVKKGMTFIGWDGLTTSMPAHNLTVTGTYSWSKETIGGVTYQVADTLNNYVSVVGYEGRDGEAEIFPFVEIGGEVYEVYSIAENALPKTVTIHVPVGRLLFWLWANGYNNIKDLESGSDLSAPEVSLVAKTASSLTLSFVNRYPQFTETVKVSGSTIEKGENGYKVTLKGLEPDKLYEDLASVTLTYEDATCTMSYSFQTASLILTTQQPKVITQGNVIVAAETNLDDGEEKVGFEWRRTDWTDEFASNYGTAYLYEGKMEGYIRNLYVERLWKYRPYYEANSGNRYYGDWVGIDPTNTSYFEPTVHTYAQITVNGNTAEVRGYAMRGTDNIVTQGFVYWQNTSAYSLRKKAASIPSDAVTVTTAKVNVMTAALEDLEYETEYCCVAFVTTSENETFYGEPQTFTTSIDPDGIKSLTPTLSKGEGEWYDLSGRKLDKPQKGINIIRYADGTSKKVLVR